MRISDWSSDVCSSDLPIGHGAIVRGGIAVDLDPIPSFGMADVVDHDVVMLAPEEGDRREAFSPAEHVACRRRTLPLGDRPMLDADIVAGLGVGPARDIACREDAGRARFEEGVDQDRKSTRLNYSH